MISDYYIGCKSLLSKDMMVVNGGKVLVQGEADRQS